MKSGMGRYVLLFPRDKRADFGRIGGSFRSPQPSEEELGKERCHNGLDNSEDGRLKGLTRQMYGLRSEVDVLWGSLFNWNVPGCLF